MNLTQVFDHLFRSRPPGVPPVAAPCIPDEPIRLPPTVEPHELPPEFESILEVQVLGYREELKFVDEQRQRVLDPIWTLVPKDR